MKLKQIWVYQTDTSLCSSVVFSTPRTIMIKQTAQTVALQLTTEGECGVLYFDTKLCVKHKSVPLVSVSKICLLSLQWCWSVPRCETELTMNVQQPTGLFGQLWLGLDLVLTVNKQRERMCFAWLGLGLLLTVNKQGERERER